MNFEPTNESGNKRRSNALIATWITAGMCTLAALATLATLMTTNWRRAGDSVRPELPSFGQSLMVSLGMFFLVAATIGLVIAWFNRRR